MMFINEIHKILPGMPVKENLPLSPLCTLGVGGEAETFAMPESVDDMKKLFGLALKYGLSVYVLGGGSNIIFPDGLVKGLVISTLNLKSITWKNEFSADIESGVILSFIMKTLKEKGLGGIEFSAGIPGTLGGAVNGNAGAGGHGICELCESVSTIEEDGGIRTWKKDEIEFSYRNCSLSKGNRIIISALMTFRRSTPDDKNIYENFMLKRSSQPHGFHNAGCTFKNPEGYSAGKLLDECGCKNLSVGDAFVSDKHANFILNRGKATSSDVMELIRICARKVYDSTGIKLEPEIKVLDPCFKIQ